MSNSFIRRLCLALAGLWLACAVRADIPNPFPAEEVSLRTLPNGLRLVMREDHSLPIVAMEVVVRGGSAADGDSPGVAHYCEHLVFQGTKHFPGHLAPQAALEQVGGISEATTSRDMTRFSATAPAAQLPLLVSVLADVMLAPTLDADDFDRERATVLAEIQRDGDSPLAPLLNAGYLASYPTHAYHGRPTGTIEDVLRLSVDDVRRYHHAWYVPNNMSVVLVGDVTAARAVALVTQAFGAAKRGEVPDWPAPAPPVPPASPHVARPGTDTYQLLVLPAPAANDLAGTVAADVLMTMLTEGDNSLLAAQWAHDGIPVIDFGGEFITSRAPARLMLWARTDPRLVGKLKRSTQALLAQLAAGTVPGDAFLRARETLATHLLLDNETYSEQAATLAFYEGLAGVDGITRYLPAVLALTPAQLQAAVPLKPLAWITMGARPEEGE